MKLFLRRSQKSGGMLGGKIIFALDARIEPSDEEQSLIKKYKLGSEIVYSSENARKHANAAVDQSNRGTFSGVAKGMMSLGLASLSLTCTIDSLSRGQHIECKDLDELMGAESAIRDACEGAKAYIELAGTFDGREEVVEV